MSGGHCEHCGDHIGTCICDSREPRPACQFISPAELARLREVERRARELADRVKALEEELAESWSYALYQESIDKGDGWLCPYMNAGRFAGPQLVQAGLYEKHPAYDWYRPLDEARWDG